MASNTRDRIRQAAEIAREAGELDDSPESATPDIPDKLYFRIG